MAESAGAEGRRRRLPARQRRGERQPRHISSGWIGAVAVVVHAEAAGAPELQVAARSDSWWGRSAPDLAAAAPARARRGRPPSQQQQRCGGSRTSGSAADAECSSSSAGGIQLRDAGEGCAAAMARERGDAVVVDAAGEQRRPAAAPPAGQRLRQRGGAVSTGRTCDFDEITTTRWR
ncbi:hypothetical protein Scep_021325 [Stephania cephalantha]|uniref:Uncharacterized protein n=1 Tax=Stephania cephalantha TaxID=152367 RepID=A0AAP0F380_9MAGN